MDRVDNFLHEHIIKHLDKCFYVEGNAIHDRFEKDVLGPHQLKSQLIDTFDVDPDWVHMVIYKWVFDNGMENISDAWHLIHLNIHAHNQNYGGQFNAGGNVYGGYDFANADLTFTTGTTTTWTIENSAGNVVVGQNSCIHDDNINLYPIGTVSGMTTITDCVWDSDGLVR